MELINWNEVASTVKEVLLVSMVWPCMHAERRWGGRSMHCTALQAPCICPPVATQCMVRSNHQKWMPLTLQDTFSFFLFFSYHPPPLSPGHFFKWSCISCRGTTALFLDTLHFSTEDFAHEATPTHLAVQATREGEGRAKRQEYTYGCVYSSLLHVAT